MDKKQIEPTDAMVDEAANALALETSGTALHLQSDAAKHTYRHRARVALRVVLNHPGAAGPFAADADRPWEPLKKGDPLHVGDEVRQDWYGTTTTAIVGRVDGDGDPWTAEGAPVGSLDSGTWHVRRTTQEPPTEPGAVIVPAEGREFIEASALHVTGAQYCREAVYEDPYYYGVWWRDGKAVHNGWRAEDITPGTWKVADQ